MAGSSPRPVRSSSLKARMPTPGGGRARYAAGFRKGDVVLNTFSYHLTPGGFIFDTSARALGCAVIPAGPGNTEAQFELIEAYSPVGYCGTPDFLKILLDAAKDTGRNVSSLGRAVVSGAAFPKSLQEEIKARGIDAYQSFGTADLGLIAFETAGRESMFVRPEQSAEIARRHPELARLRLVVARENEQDTMTLRCESASSSEALRAAIAATLRPVTKLGGDVELMAPGSLPNDGKVIADER